MLNKRLQKQIALATITLVIVLITLNSFEKTANIIPNPKTVLGNAWYDASEVQQQKIQEEEYYQQMTQPVEEEPLPTANPVVEDDKKLSDSVFSADPIKYDDSSDLVSPQQTSIGQQGSKKTCEVFFENLYRSDPDWQVNLMFVEQYSDDSLGKVLEMLHIVDQYTDCIEFDGDSRFPFLRSKALPFFNTGYNSQWPVFKKRGIVTTFGEKDIPLAKSLFKVLRSMTDLPIEVIHQNELPADLDLGPNVTFINIQERTNPAWAFSVYYNKWYAIAFSTFEEIMLIDVDAVPFIKPEKFFQIANGETLLFKDRQFDYDKKRPECASIVDHIPHVTPDFKSEYGDKSIYDRFYKDGERHLIDSGIVITNRKNNLKSLMAAFSLELTTLVRKCFHGDKDLFWLGHIFMNQTVHIHHGDAVMVGELKAGKICGSQIAHAEGENLMWLNGGLTFCKDTKAFEMSRDVEYWTPKGLTSGDIKHMYEQPIKFDYMISPRIPQNRWDRSDLLCYGRLFCLRADAENPYTPLNPTNKVEVDNIASIWHNAA